MCKCADSVRYEGNVVVEVEKHLTILAVDGYNWRTLFICPETGIYWEETRPQSELQGGGPPVLTQVSKGYVDKEWSDLMRKQEGMWTGASEPE